MASVLGDCRCRWGLTRSDLHEWCVLLLWTLIVLRISVGGIALSNLFRYCTYKIVLLEFVHCLYTNKLLISRDLQIADIRRGSKVDIQTYRELDIQTDIQTDRRSARPSDRHSDRHTARPRRDTEDLSGAVSRKGRGVRRTSGEEGEGRREMGEWLPRDTVGKA